MQQQEANTEEEHNSGVFGSLNSLWLVKYQLSRCILNELQSFGGGQRSPDQERIAVVTVYMGKVEHRTA